MSHTQQLEAKLLHANGTYLQLLSTAERGGVGRDASQAIANQLLNRRNSLLIGARQCQSPPLISFIRLHLEEEEERLRIQSERLKRQKEQLMMKAKIAANDARLSVLKNSAVGSCKKASSDDSKRKKITLIES